MTRHARPPNFSVPDRLPGDMFDRGLAPEHVGLLLAAWSESSRYQLDGRIAATRMRRVGGWTARRERDLIDAGFVAEDAGDLVLVDYLSVNKSRAVIEALREARAAAGAVGGSVTASSTPRVAGKFSDGCPHHRVSWRKSRFAGYFCPEFAVPDGPVRTGGRCGARPDVDPSATPNATPNAGIADDAALGPIHAQSTKQPTKQLLPPYSYTNSDTYPEGVGRYGTDAEASGSEAVSGGYQVTRCFDCSSTVRPTDAAYIIVSGGDVGATYCWKCAELAHLPSWLVRRDDLDTVAQ